MIYSQAAVPHMNVPPSWRKPDSAQPRMHRFRVDRTVQVVARTNNRRNVIVDTRPSVPRRSGTGAPFPPPANAAATADFMAPEMVTGKERQGTGMDWWALGVMLYEITLGTLPFHSELVQSSNEVFRSIVNKELKFPRRHNLSRSAVDFIRELLRKVWFLGAVYVCTAAGAGGWLGAVRPTGRGTQQSSTSLQETKGLACRVFATSESYYHTTIRPCLPAASVLLPSRRFRVEFVGQSIYMVRYMPCELVPDTRLVAPLCCRLNPSLPPSTFQDPAERLGQRKGVGEIKRHAFFGSVHWALIANSTPPFVLSGPDTPGWLASMQAAPDAGSRDDKMATWTWMVSAA